MHPKQARVTSADIEQLEREMDAMNAELPALRSFVLPGGTRLNAELHAARTICRRAERLVVTLARTEEVPADAIRYLNRLSDALFVWSRWANHVLGVAEALWEPNQSTSGRIILKRAAPQLVTSIKSSPTPRRYRDNRT